MSCVDIITSAHLLLQGDVDDEHIVGLALNFFSHMYLQLIDKGDFMGFYKSPITKPSTNKYYKETDLVETASIIRYQVQIIRPHSESFVKAQYNLLLRTN